MQCCTLPQTHRYIGMIFTFWYRWCFSCYCSVFIWKIITWSYLGSLLVICLCYGVLFVFMYGFQSLFDTSYAVLPLICGIILFSFASQSACSFPCMLLQVASVHCVTKSLAVGLMNLSWPALASTLPYFLALLQSSRQKKEPAVPVTALTDRILSHVFLCMLWNNILLSSTSVVTVINYRRGKNCVLPYLEGRWSDSKYITSLTTQCQSRNGQVGCLSATAGVAFDNIYFDTQSGHVYVFYILFIKRNSEIALMVKCLSMTCGLGICCVALWKMI